MALGKRRFTRDELLALSQMDSRTSLPQQAQLDDYLKCRTLKPFYSVAKGLGLIPSNVKKWADTKPERYGEMGIYPIGTGIRPKLFVNVAHFTRWALKNPATRRYLVYKFHKDVVPVPKKATQRDILDSGSVYLWKDLCKAGIVPKPFAGSKGLDTLATHAGKASDEGRSIGLWRDDRFGEWLVEPSSLLRFILEEYRLADA